MQGNSIDKTNFNKKRFTSIYQIIEINLPYKKNDQ